MINIDSKRLMQDPKQIEEMRGFDQLAKETLQKTKSKWKSIDEQNKRVHKKISISVLKQPDDLRAPDSKIPPCKRNKTATSLQAENQESPQSDDKLPNLFDNHAKEKPPFVHAQQSDQEVVSQPPRVEPPQQPTSENWESIDLFLESKEFDIDDDNFDCIEHHSYMNSNKPKSILSTSSSNSPTNKSTTLIFNSKM